MSEPPAASSDAGAQGAAFTGDPSLLAQAAVAGLRPLHAAADLLGIDIGTQLAPLIATTSPPDLAAVGLWVGREQFDGMPVVTIRPATPSGKVVVGVHGGAYVVQPTVMHWLDYATMARDTGATVVVPIYPLAHTPQGRAATVVPALADLVTAQIGAHGAANVSLYGDSAGGGLALATAQELVRRAATRPAHMVLISPWLDVSMTNPAIATVADPILGTAALRKAGTWWAGTLPLTDPLVSPLYGSLAGLPPTGVYSGSLDVLSPDALVLRDKARAAGAAFTFVLRKGLIHDWALGGLPVPPEGPAVRPDIYRQLGLTA
ncbi:alpha/beta hydrolase fold domain-containing protein [Nocardia testacea]|uniref:alpha/beta hydrolase fold domain-containing protein n=1 Tax=Nocardia testacea TaxID=248551 RepID=UPI003A8A552B